MSSSRIGYLGKTVSAVGARGRTLSRTGALVELAGGAVPLAPVNTVLPVITGTVRDGETLTCSEGSWDNLPSSYAYQWYEDGSPIIGATSSTLPVVPSMIPALLTCAVIASNAGGDSAPATSAAVSSPLRAIYQIDPNARVWVHTQGTGVSVASPVETWTTADGAWTMTQSVSGSRPTREAGGVNFNGVTDYMTADDSASLFNAAYTIAAGCDNLPLTNETRQLCGSYTAGVSTATRRCSHINMSCGTAASLTRMRFLLGGNSSAAQVDLRGLFDATGVGPFDLACRSATPGAGDGEGLELADPLVSLSTLAWPTVSTSNDRFTVGAQRLDATALSFFAGDIRYVVALTLEASDANLDDVHDALVGEGVL
jgi:hypothetical protein